MSIFSLVCVSDTVATTKGAVWVSGVFAPSKTFKLSATFNASLATNHKQSFDLWTSLGDVLQEEEESFHFGVASPAPAPLFFFSSRSFLEKVSLKLRHLLYTSFTFFRKEKVTETYYARFLQTFLMKYWWHKLRSKKKKKELWRQNDMWHSTLFTDCSINASAFATQISHNTMHQIGQHNCNFNACNDKVGYVGNCSVEKCCHV